MKAFDEAQETLEGFTLTDAETVTVIYVCAQCEGELRVIPSDWELAFHENNLFHVICPDCGFVEQIGRISKTTVAIRNERGVWDYPKVIRALPDLWGELIPTKEDINVIINQLGF